MSGRHVGLAVVAAATVAVFLPGVATPAAALALALAGTFLVERSLVRSALRLGVVMMLILAASVTVAAVTSAAGLERGLRVGGAFVARLVVLVLASTVAGRTVDAEALVRGAAALGIERLGLVIGLALNAFPRLAEASRQVVIAQWVRSGSRHRLVAAAPALAEVLLAHAGRIAEEAAGAAALRGHAALVRPGRARLRVPTRVVVVTGRPGGGKTTASLEVARLAATAGVPVAGFVQPGSWQLGKRSAFAVRDLATGEEAALAVRVGRSEGEHGTGFRFDRRGFDLARRAVQRVVAGSLLVVDELGPLELRGRGHMRAVARAVACEGLVGVVVVVRRSLVPALLASLGADDAVVVDLDVAGARTPLEVVRALGLDVRL